MVDVASITVAVISLVATVGVAVLGGFLTIYNDDRKAHREQERLLRRYRDPLLLAAQDLQARLWNILDGHLVSMCLAGGESKQDPLFIYTAYVFGQYLSWTYILRRQAQFVCFATNEGRSKTLVQKLEDIKAIMNTDGYGPNEDPFMLWKGQQLAIGELMSCHTSKDDTQSELMCMGYAEFTRLWKTARVTDANLVDNARDEAVFFRQWFDGVEEGIYAIEEGRRGGDHRGANRIRRLQHALVDLINELDPRGVRVNSREAGLVSAAHDCACSQCAKVKSLGRGADAMAKV
jgi:hypothetical protein